MTTTTRCSALPIAWSCAESQNAAPDEVRINQSSEPAEVGTAAHRWLASYVKGIELDKRQIAQEHGCDVDELSMLCAMGLKVLGQIKEKIGAVWWDALQTEVPLSAKLDDWLSIVGTADLLGRDSRTALVTDYKTGRIDSEYAHQLRGYAYCALDHFGPEVSEVVAITAWLREGYWDIERFTRAQIRDWADEYRKRIRNGRGIFNPGSHCGYCSRKTNCPARQALIRQTVADLSVEGAPVVAWTPETRAALGPQIGTMYGRVKLIEKAAEDFRDTLRADIEQHGPISIGGGRQLALTPVNRRELDVAKARPVLASFVTQDEIDAATKISVSAIEKAAVEKPPKGKGAQTKRDMTAALEAAQAITVNTTYSLRETKENQS